jgi:hypothetical protein
MQNYKSKLKNNAKKEITDQTNNTNIFFIRVLEGGLTDQRITRLICVNRILLFFIFAFSYVILPFDF